jgi:hypothetical protein
LFSQVGHQSYLETIAFLQLLRRLLSVSDARSLQEITSQFRPEEAVLGPYLRFVVDDVFLKNDTRSFKGRKRREEGKLFKGFFSCRSGRKVADFFSVLAGDVGSAPAL